jgi:hypothetical protein
MGLSKLPDCQQEGPASFFFDGLPWYEAYMAALFEPEPHKLAARILYAEQLIVARERELFSVPSDFAERDALNSKLHALRALRGCLKPEPTQSELLRENSLKLADTEVAA